MVFSSISFLVFFLPAVLLCYFIIPKRFRGLRNFELLVFSLFFYGWGGPRLVALLLVSVLINYVCGLFAVKDTTKGRLAVFISVFLHIILIGWFKYAGFLAETINSFGIDIPVPEVVLPIGISFFTFQGLSYVIDVYRGDAHVQKNPIYVALYISMFPQLVAGPIVRYTTVEDAILHRNENVPMFAEGVVRFLFGLGKKMLIANTMGEIADEIFALSTDNITTTLAWVGIIAYTLQIYYDFSAYSDMAIGLGKMFGFQFPENFNYPYISKSITEFWRRWHISLSTWFRDYVYIPLGGNRKGAWKHVRNIIIVWLLTGLWHGAAWTFVFWGAWYCVLLLAEKFVWGKLLDRSPALFKHIYTMFFVILGWVFFRSLTLDYALEYIQVMFGFSEAGFYDGQATYYMREFYPEFIVGLIAVCPLKNKLHGYLERNKGNRLCDIILMWGPVALAFALLLLSYSKLAMGSFNPFIYFQF